MSLLIFAIIVVVIAVLGVWAISLLGIGYPIDAVLKVAIILVAIIVICNHAGMLA